MLGTGALSLTKTFDAMGSRKSVASQPRIVGHVHFLRLDTKYLATHLNLSNKRQLPLQPEDALFRIIINGPLSGLNKAHVYHDALVRRAQVRAPAT
jgi:hypothetical protein